MKIRIDNDNYLHYKKEEKENMIMIINVVKVRKKIISKIIIVLRQLSSKTQREII